ncbi:8208_t:CDS:2, partial [Dentiscutata erythropus]
FGSLRGSKGHSSGKKKAAQHAGRKPAHKKQRRRRKAAAGAPKRNESKRIIPKIVVRNPTRKIASMFKKPNIFNEGFLAPPAQSKQKMSKEKDKNKEHEKEDRILASFSLPSHSAPQIRKSHARGTGGFKNILWRYLGGCFDCLDLDTNELSEEHERSAASEPVVIMGDFNASGSYVVKKDQSKLDEILRQNNLVWGIQHSDDTNVATGDNAYDRFIFEKESKQRWIGPSRVW